MWQPEKPRPSGWGDVTTYSPSALGLSSWKIGNR
jgi:hypothetical protein